MTLNTIAMIAAGMFALPWITACDEIRSAFETTGVGVEVCDEYIAKVEACQPARDLDIISRDSYEMSSRHTINRWKEAASTEEGKKTLTTGCQTALDSFKCCCKALDALDIAQAEMSDG